MPARLANLICITPTAEGERFLIRGMKICLITPEIAPLVRNGGVGTNALNLATYLSREAGHDVTILVSRVLESLSEEECAWVERRSGARLALLQNEPHRWDTAKTHPRELARSLEVLWWLEERDFDTIHFMQYHAPGFASVRAKRLGRAFQKTPLVVIVNSPERWLAEMGQRRPDGSSRGLLLDYMERYCLEHADHVVCPSRAMLDWMRKDGWRLSPGTRWLPTHSPEVELPDRRPEDRNHLVFFGRLETRKGLELFAEALHVLASRRDLRTAPLRITFLGKIGAAGARSARTHLNERLAELPEAWRWEILDGLDQASAMEFLARHSGALFVTPSLADNCPNTVLECLRRRLRVLATDVPGVSELFAEGEPLSAPRPDALAGHLENFIRNGRAPARAAFSDAEALAARAAFLDELAGEAARLRAEPPAARAEADPELITVVVPAHNMGTLLAETLLALAEQDDPRFEVIVVDDGSTDAESLAVLTALERGNRDPRFRFVRQAQGGVCAARNRGAAVGSGELLVFVDADNIPLPHMLSTMRKRLGHAGLDALTCDLYAFQHGSPDPLADLQLRWSFAGGCLEAAILSNSLGDSNMMVRRHAFDAVGGFVSANEEASADRAFLVRLLRRRFRLDCTDECLFAYRLRGSSMSRTASNFERARTVMAAFTEEQEPWLQRLLEATFPVYESGKSAQSKASSDREASAELARLKEKAEELKRKLEIERFKRRERDARADRLYARLNEWRHCPLVRLARFLRMIPRDY